MVPSQPLSFSIEDQTLRSRLTRGIRNRSRLLRVAKAPMSSGCVHPAKPKAAALLHSPVQATLSNCPFSQHCERSAEVARRVRMQFAPQISPAFPKTSISIQRAMNAYMAADAQGDQQIRSVVRVPVMDYQRRTLATTTAAVALQHARAVRRKTVANPVAGHNMSGRSRGFSARSACRTDRGRTIAIPALASPLSPSEISGSGECWSGIADSAITQTDSAVSETGAN